jgi:hypothetical protein
MATSVCAVYIFFTGENTDQMFVSVASDQQLYDGDNKTTVVNAYPDNQGYPDPLISRSAI